MVIVMMININNGLADASSGGKEHYVMSVSEAFHSFSSMKYVKNKDLQ